MISQFERIISGITNFFTIGASGIAVYLFFFKRKTIASALNLLLNYSHQLTLSDLKSKLERLNDFDANDEKHNIIVLNILNEIEGQIKGNRTLKKEFFDILQRIQEFTLENEIITEPKKRSLVSELRENLKNLDLENFKNTY